MQKKEEDFLKELTELSYKYNIIVIKTTNNQIVPVEINQDDIGGEYRLDNNNEIVFM